MAAAVAALLLLAACSTNNSSTGVGCAGNTGSFSNASLPANSQWTYELSGWQATSGGGATPYREAGVFTVDGNGNITGLTDDFFQQGTGTAVTTTGITGKYSISANGTGSILLTLSTGTLSWAITMQGNSFYIIEADSFATAHGIAHKQAGSFAAPSGTFAFRTHALGNVSGFWSAVGEMTVSGGTISGGSVDVLNNGALSTLAVSGSFAAPDTAGRGAAAINYGGNIFSFEYYLVDASTVQLFETDSNLGLGRMEAQTGAGSFTNASFSGPYAFGSFGDSNLNFGGANTVGQITADGSGNLTSGTYDQSQDYGTPGAVTSLAGTYNVASSGRFAMTINGAGANPVAVVGYLVNAPASAGRAFFLINDSSKYEDGTMDLQSKSSFALTDVSGQFAFVMGGNDSANLLDRTGIAIADGKGGLEMAYLINRLFNTGGIVSEPGCLTGTYTVSSNGRVVGNVGSLSSNLVTYMVNANQAYVMQADAGAQVYGGMAVQSQAVADPPGTF